MSELKRQGYKAYIWDFAGRITTHGVGFVVSIFLARLLDPADFGLIAMVMVVIGIAGIFTDMGLASALIQRQHLLPVHYASVFYFNIAVGAILTLSTYFSATFISEFYHNISLIPLMQVVSSLFIINAMGAVQSALLRKRLNYARLSKINLVASLMSGSAGVLLAFYGVGVWSLVVQSLSQGIIYSLSIWWLSDWKPSMMFSFKALFQLWTFGFRLFLSALLETIFTRMDTIIIAKLFTPAALGFYNRAKSLDQMVVSYSSASIMSVLFPLLSKVQRDIPRFQNIIVRALGVIVFLTFLLLGELYLVAHEIIIMLFGEKWLQSVEYFKILALSGFGFPVSALLVNVLSSRGNSKAFLRLEIYKKIIFSINLSIGFVWGIEGYLYGLILVMLLGVFLNVQFVSKEIFLPKSSLIKPIVLQMAITAVAVGIVQNLNPEYDLPLHIIFLIKSIEYTAMYILINRLLNVDAFNYFLAEGKPILSKLQNRVK